MTTERSELSRRLQSVSKSKKKRQNIVWACIRIGSPLILKSKNPKDKLICWKFKWFYGWFYI